MSVVLSIDAGTTGVRTVAVDEAGSQVASAYREFTQHFPEPGWVEHDAEEIWLAVNATLGEVAGAIEEKPVAIGITNQRETIVAWSRSTSEPVHRALVWQDRRTSDRCAELEADGLLPKIRETTGLVLDPYFSASKIEWLLKEARLKVSADLAFGTIDSWLLWKLTGGAVHATDATNASRTLLFDLEKLAWSDDLLELFGVPADLLPDVKPSNALFGTTTADAACGAGIPIHGIAGDQHASLFGQAAFATGDTKNTYGTGSFVLMNVGQTCPAPAEGLLTTLGWLLQDGQSTTPTYALEGAIFVTGAAIQWLRDGLQIVDRADQLESLALECDSTGDVYLVPAFTGLGSPYWDPYARGTIVGMTRGTGRAELARATIEAIVYQTRDVVDAMSAAAGSPVRSLRVDGGASAMQLLLQLQANQLGVPVRRPRQIETTALGAAYLAGYGMGLWPTLEAVQSHWQLDVEVVPDPNRSAPELQAGYEQWKRAVDRSRAWAS